MGVRRLLLASLVILLAAGASSAGQQAITTASLTGRVTDTSGAVIAGATVTIRSVDRNQQQHTTTTTQGLYRFLLLPVGPYELTVRADGFAEQVIGLTLTLGQAADLPVALSLAGVASTVDVAAETPLVEARRTQAADLITPQEIDALPLNGRNFLDLALLAPGVSRTAQRNTERFAETSAVPGTGISVAGQRNLNNTFLVDGLSANDDAAGLAATYFAQEVIREFQVVTSGGIAEFGRASAGIVNIVTQSGANRRSGRAYGYFRDDRLDARNPLASGKEPLRQVQFGATLSGPAVRDRAFWFGNVEQTRLDRTGIITIAAANAEAINRVLDAHAYRGPRVDSGEFPTGYHTTNVFGRADIDLPTATRMALRYSLYDVSSRNARSVGGLNAVSRGTPLDDRDQTLAATWQTIRSASSVNEFRGQATRSRLDAPPNDPSGPAVTIAGAASFGTSTNAPTARDLDVFELSDSYTVQRRAHLVKAGATLLYERLSIAFPGALQGVYTFSSLANFESGRYVNFQQAFGEAIQTQSSPNLGAFVQDEWRPRQDLTLNAGLRYDLQGMPRPVRTDANNISPRLGVSFAPADGRTVIRAAGGLYYDRIPLRAVSNALQRDGTKYRAALLTFGQAGAPTFPGVLAAFPPTLLTNITTIDASIQSSVGRQASAQIERQVGRTLTMTLGYLHLTGRGIIMSRNTNEPTMTAAQAALAGDPNLGRPDPRFGNNAQYQSIGRSQFDGLTVSLRSSSPRWGLLRASYTFSRALDDAGNAFFSSPQDNKDVHGDWGRSDNDQRHRLVVSGAAPSVRGVRFAYLFSYASAPPFNIQTGNDRNNDTNPNDRPAGVGRNTGIGFDAATLDLRISRAFRLGGPHRLEIIVDAFNVLNRANFLIPNNVWGTGVAPLPSFGQPTAASDPRQVQLGARWTF